MELTIELVQDHVFNDNEKRWSEYKTRCICFDDCENLEHGQNTKSVTSLFWSKMEKMFWLLAKAKSVSKNSYHFKFTDKGIA